MADSAQQILHPVYLDVPMMVSFLAALRGGVSFEDEAIRRSSSSTDREREGGGRIRVPSLFSLLGFDASGRMSRKEHGAEDEEIKAVRQHTAASLFIALHEALREGDLVRKITGPEDLTEICPGDLVEVSGEFVGNPLQEVVGFFAKAVPYFDITESQETPDADVVRAEVEVLAGEAASLRDEAAKAKRSGNPTRQAQAGELEEQAATIDGRANELIENTLEVLRERQEQAVGVQMFIQMRDDLAAAAVHDTVINGPELQVLLTLSAEFFTDATSAYLRDGIFRAVGKVTRVLGEGDEISLLRRTVLGAAGPQLGRELIQNAVTEGNLTIKTFDPIIQAPAVQILPLAVYV